MTRRWVPLVLFLALSAVPALALAGEPASMEALRASIFAPAAATSPAPEPAVGGVPEPTFMAGSGEKAICTQNFCPGGGYVSCQTYPPYDTCKVKCGGVKCEGQDFIKCPNPCCTRTITCWDGSVVTCRNWRTTDCSTMGEGVECDGVCPPPPIEEPCYSYPYFNCN